MLGGTLLSLLNAPNVCEATADGSRSSTCCNATIATSASVDALCGQKHASRDNVTVLDGGNGHMLRRLGVRIEGEVGSMRRFLGVAMANVEQPDLVLHAHKAYIDAGATVITTNSYACVPACLELAGVTRDELREHIRAAGRVASRAAKTSGKNVRVAGCLPPLSASYRPDLVGDSATLLEEYAFIAKTIAPFSQVLLCETMSTIREGVAAATAASALDLPVWIAWTLSDVADGTLRSGETIEEAVHAVSHIPNVEAILLNCLSPEAVDAAVTRLRHCTPASIANGVYPNGFVVEERGQRDEYRTDLSPEKYLARAQHWVSEGCTIVGGCCGVFPEHIKLISAKFTSFAASHIIAHVSLPTEVQDLNCSESNCTCILDRMVDRTSAVECAS